MTTPGSDPRFDALTDLALGTLPDDQRVALEAWLAGDPAAQAQFRAVREAIGALAVSVPQIDPPPDLRDRVLAVAGVAQPHERGRPRPQAVAASSRRAAPPVGWLAAAAAILLALGLGTYALRLRADVARLEATLEATSARLATAEAEAQVSRTRLMRARAETSILSAPDLRRVDLAGQPGAPAAAARAFWSRAQGLVLTATRLPDLPRGRTYQLWVLTAGPPVSAGLFETDAAGGATVVFDTPVGLPTPTGLAVSVEPAGGVPAPTGAIVLAGKAD
jgi:anti-sigma-K factor RskA